MKFKNYAIVLLAAQQISFKIKFLNSFYWINISNNNLILNLFASITFTINEARTHNRRGGA